MTYSTPRGTRDLMPEQAILLEEVLEKVRLVFRKYGFEPVETPAFEELEVLEKKSGEEVRKQIFRVGESEKLGLRFDLTVPLARLMAGNSSLPKPFKRYHIGRVWRHEEPQKGRFREFYQADVDVVGSAGAESDAEVLACAKEALEAIGLKPRRIRVNNRKILDAMFAKLGLKAGATQIFRALDKLDKQGRGAVESELKGLGLSAGDVEAVMKVAGMKGSNEEKLAFVKKEFPNEGADELRALFKSLEDYGVEAEFDLSLVRGLDYYTGPVFEISGAEGLGSIAAGGRYDNLIELYGSKPVPATGISLGIERLMELLKPQRKTFTRVYVAAAKDEYRSEARRMVAKLRKAGISAQTDLMGRKLGKQFEYVNSKGIPYAIVIGEREMKEKKVTLRDMKGGAEKSLTFEEAVKALA
ncbi:Histidine--tRNA ligase [Candidatus Burarchaeum australiense]|nr:Histidine--tRNA ligase [Candidatus Burarchaeum australiense]